MAENMIGNFAFMYHINRELYEKLYSAEKQARTNFRNSGHESREALEILIKTILNRHNLSNACKGQELRAKIDNLRDETFLKSVGYLKNDEALSDKPILPDLGEVTFKYKNGREETTDYWDFMRKYGNTCSHADTRPSDVKLSYENTIKCLKGLFLLLKRYYKGQIPHSVGAFDEYGVTGKNYKYICLIADAILNMELMNGGGCGKIIFVTVHTPAKSNK